VHLDNPKDKFNTICLMIDKLYALVNGDILPENLDSTAVHEVLLPGHLYLMLLREKLEDSLSFMRTKMIKDLASSKTPSKIIELEYLKKNLENGMVGKAL
jgi:DNA-directed RNA polymerase I subunit RPA2